MFYVYILQSLSSPNQSYVGYTNNLSKRLAAHNAGHSIHTSRFKPWKIVTYVAFSDQSQAIEFEKYLKTSSGIAFMNRRFLQPVSP